MLFKGGFIFCFILLFLCGVANAQMTINYSPIAYSTSGVTATGGSPFTFFGKNKCLVVGNGMSVLTVVFNSNGDFGKACVEDFQRASLLNELVTLKVFPNPTIGPVMVKCEGQFESKEIANLKIMSMDGRQVSSQMIVMKELQAGLPIQTGSFASGTYLINIDLKNQRLSSKLIKL